ncbi:MAG: hypothetical protein ACREVT_05390 [Burkholderiales bacterium]
MFSVLWRWLFCFLMLMMMKSVATADVDSLEQYRIAYEYKGAIFVISGTGKTIFKLPFENLYLPDAHPDGDRIVCVRKNKSNSSELIELTLDKEANFPTTVLYTATVGQFIGSPIWSQDGSQVGFLVSRKVLVLDMKARQIALQIEINELPTVPDPTFTTLHDNHYMRWSKDGLRLYLRVRKTNGERNQTNPGLTELWRLGEIEISSGSFFWHHNASFNFLYNRIFPKTTKVHESPAIVTLFGSVENPVLRPIWSPDRRYFFYETLREGFMAKGWIERYDTETKKSKAIKTLWWAPYVE